MMMMRPEDENPSEFMPSTLVAIVAASAHLVKVGGACARVLWVWVCGCGLRGVGGRSLVGRGGDRERGTLIGSWVHS